MSEIPESTEPEFYEEFGVTPTTYVDIPALIAGLTLDEWEEWVTTVGATQDVPVTRADMWALVAQLHEWRHNKRYTPQKVQ